MDIFAPLIIAALIAGILGALGLAAFAWGADSRPGVADDPARPPGPPALRRRVALDRPIGECQDLAAERRRFQQLDVGREPEEAARRFLGPVDRQPEALPALGIGLRQPLGLADGSCAECVG